MALRDLGAARTSALYATAPFLGMLLAVTINGERPGLTFLLAVPLMAAGAFLLLREDHQHFHRHVPLEHEHNHCHNDAHHGHDHAPGEPASIDRHSHAHRHAPIAHAHPHAPDLHHRHEHQEVS
jgi:ABC-type nickel/cobalt efflux system permease component RcnA